MNDHIPAPVLKALLHVRSVFPDVVMVVFGADTRWHYMSEEFEAPSFGDKINQGILEDAVQDLGDFPCVYQLEEEAVRN